MTTPEITENTAPEPTWWHIDVVCQFFGGTKPLHPATIYRGIKDGRYPPPAKVGPNINRWVPDECIEARARIISERDAA